ncbi:hypothetical protein DPMN_081912 [Dreissena polymorpha]|uniref:Uncharacterized protein n=1 Tax=Dreissena polymorpha TaxID=45954 RepID=A0A9D3Y9R1_DREPO|nr:hypothetical protein DPMN_081912 [Dreissena polymorpha]
MSSRELSIRKGLEQILRPAVESTTLSVTVTLMPGSGKASSVRVTVLWSPARGMTRRRQCCR